MPRLSSVTCWIVTGRLVAALGLLVCPALLGAGEPAVGSEVTWRLQSDFLTARERANPNVDQYEFSTWHLLRTTRSEGTVENRRWLRDGRYVPLAEQGDKLFGLPLDGWAFRAGEQALAPSLGRLTAPQDLGLPLSAGDLLLAPGLDHALVIGWRSPVAGSLRVAGSFEHAQNCCGDNSRIAWYVERGPAPDPQHGFQPLPLASGTADFGTPSQVGRFDLTDLTVASGDWVYFIVDALADGSATPHAGDGTRLEVTLTVRGAPPPSIPSYAADIAPLLAARCAHCHDADTREGRLQVTSLAALLAGGSNGPAVVPGSPRHSLLIDKIESGEMPPGKEDRLSTDEVALLRRWVKSTAAEPLPADASLPALFTSAEREHWAFQPLVAPVVPEVQSVELAQTPIDRFLLAKLESRGWRFSPPADRATWLRRATLDLTGLPPTPAELVRFEHDSRPDAWEQVVDRLLASPQFGVRWGRHWLDIAGYTDTISFDEDFGPPIGFLEGKWRYRDYVIDAFNSDKPYDQFVQEQLAGDELVDWRNAAEYTPEILEKLTATGYLRTVEDISVEDPRPFVIWSTVHETMEQGVGGLLGLTLQCARCHSHKFEPIPQRDYYSLMSLFTPALNPQRWKNARERLLPDVAPPVQQAIAAHNADLDRQVAAVQQQSNALRQEYSQRLREAKLQSIPEALRTDLQTALQTPAEKQDVVQKYLVGKLGPLVKVEPAEIDAALTPADRQTLQTQAQQVADLNGRRRSHGWIHAVYDVGPAPATQIFQRGEFDQPGRDVPAGFLRVLTDPQSAALPTPGTDSVTSGRRTALARWITAPDSPASGLAARVMVNRIWLHLFGEGLAVNADNVGLSGSPPTHPELLDWLAADFRSQGWKIKRMLRQMVLSTAYRQSSAMPPGEELAESSAARRDPDNTLLWRMRLRRLDAEALRDAVVAQGGRLDERLGGAPLPLVYDLKTGGVAEEELTPARPAYRRAVYLVNRRVYHPTLLSVFDKPVVSRGICQREESTTALQSLSLMNDGFLLANAERCADRLIADGAADAIESLYRLVLSRSPSAEERTWCSELLEAQRALYGQAGAAPGEASRRALANLCHTLWGANDFLYLK